MISGTAGLWADDGGNFATFLYYFAAFGVGSTIEFRYSAMYDMNFNDRGFRKLLSIGFIIAITFVDKTNSNDDEFDDLEWPIFDAISKTSPKAFTSSYKDRNCQKDELGSCGKVNTAVDAIWLFFWF